MIKISQATKWRLLYWCGYAFFISGILLVVFPHAPTVTRCVGLPALLLGALLGWQARRIGYTPARINRQLTDSPTSKSQRIWALCWMLGSLVVYAGLFALIVFGDFSYAGGVIILLASIILVNVPAIYLYLRYIRKS
jgi:hypothetical protein